MIQLWILIPVVYWWVEFKIVEQRSQIVWQLWIGSLLTPRVLNWLAGTIHDDHCQLSPLTPDWITKSNRREKREPPAPTVFDVINHTPTSELRYVPIWWHTKRVFRNTIEMIFIYSRDSQDPWDYQRMDCLGTLRRPADLACIWAVKIQLMCCIPTWEWALIGCQTVTTGCDK